MSTTFMLVAGCLSMGLAFAGFAWVLAGALNSGAENYAGAYSEETAKRYEDLFMFIPPRRIAEIGYALAALVFVVFALPFLNPQKPLLLVVGLVFAGGVASSMLLVPGRVLVVLKNRRRRRFNVQLVDALASMSNSLRAGFSINQAIEAVVETGENPIAQEFHVFLQQVRLGMNRFEALQSLDKRVASDDLTLVVNAIDIAQRTGGNLTEVFDKISLTIRERMRIETRVMTLTAQGRLQGFIVGAMPFLLGGVMFFIKPDLMIPFVTSMFGAIAMLGATGLVALGGYIIYRIVKIDV